MGLDLVEFVIAIEREFDVKIPDEEASRIPTLGDMHDWLSAHFGRGTNDPKASWERVVTIAHEQFGGHRSDYDGETRFLDLAPDG